MVGVGGYLRFGVEVLYLRKDIGSHSPTMLFVVCTKVNVASSLNCSKKEKLMNYGVMM
jgi:hypothetical protein